MRRLTRLLVLTVVSLAAVVLAVAEAMATDTPRIAIIIDDMGQNRALGRRALALPGPVSYAFLPHASHTRYLAERAHRADRDVLLHQPMQAIDSPLRGDDSIGLDSTHTQIRRRLAHNLAAVPHATGVNNHRGSLVTRHPGHMSWFMAALDRRGGVFFVDSRTTARTVAKRMAREAGVATAERDIFLDHERDPEAIAAAFERLVATAHRRGQAIAIGHPDPRTLAVLEKQLARLQHWGVELVPISDLVTKSGEEVNPSWHVSSSP